jgi:peptidoglycan pentaglycine glycine transferase (the first glycine)
MKIVYFSKDNKDKWNNFVIKNASDGGLLQSFQWGDLQEGLGKKIWRLGIVNEGNDLLATCLAFKDDLALGQKTIEVYRGPVINNDKKSEVKNILKLLIQELKIIAKKEKAIVIRMDFGLLEKHFIEFKNDGLSQLNFVRANRDIQPRSTFFIDLEKAEEDILQKMKSKHRYNIRLAGKKGVEVYLAQKEGESSLSQNLEKDFEKFWELMQATSKRDDFAIHHKDYYFKLLNNSGGKIKLYLAAFEGKVIAASLVGCFGGVCTYMHGASDNEYKKVMAPYMLQWQAMLDAKKDGKKYYDLGGVKSAEEKSSSQKSWDGITRFKVGFCPNNEVVEFLGLWNLPVQKVKYSLYNLIRLTVKLIKR